MRRMRQMSTPTPFEKGRSGAPLLFIRLRLYLRADLAAFVRGAVEVHVEPPLLVGRILAFGELRAGRHGPLVVGLLLQGNDHGTVRARRSLVDVRCEERSALGLEAAAHVAVVGHAYGS